MDSRSRLRGMRRLASGRLYSTPAADEDSCQSAWVRAIPCGSRRASCFTAMISMRNVPARGAAWLDREARQSRLHRAGDPLRQKAEGVKRRLVALQPEGRAIPRHGCQIFSAGQAVGVVTSGTFSPTLQHAVAMGYVAVESASPGTAVDVDVRGTRIPATVAKLPFYRRPKA